MAKVAITQSKLDNLANAVSTASGQATPLTIDQMTTIVGTLKAPTLQDKTVNITPSETAQSQTIQADSNYDGLDEVTVNVGAVSSYYIGSDIPRSAGGTVAPTESEQTAVNAGTYCEANVKVAAISQYYVGSGIPRKNSESVIVNGAVVSIPHGYYGSDVSKTVSSGSANMPTTLTDTGAAIATATNTITISKTVSARPAVSPGYIETGTQSNCDVSLTASITTKEAETITPSKTTQTIIPAGTYLRGAQTIDTIPSQYYDMSGAMAWLGKDAELIDDAVYSKTDTLANTNFNTWTPSTTATTIVSSATAKTFVADLENYEYYLLWDCACDMDYTNASPTLKAHFLFSRCYLVQQIAKRPSTFANIQANNFDGNACTSLYTSNFLRYYGTTTGSVTYSWAASYGIYFGATNATFSNTTSNTPTVTIKTPTVSARCSTTYFSTSNAAKVNQTKSTWSISGKLYRVKKEGIIRNIYDHVVSLINT